jgi:hypothetical protein
VPANQWISEAAVLLTGISAALAWSIYARFGRRTNLVWAWIMTASLALQIRVHLYQIGWMPAPFH